MIYQLTFFKVVFYSRLLLSQAATHKVKEHNQECREMFLLNTDVVIVGFFKEFLRKNGGTGNEEIAAGSQQDPFEKIASGCTVEQLT